MSTVDAFQAPFLRPLPPLLTRRQIADLRGKLDNLQEIRKKPRAQNDHARRVCRNLENRIGRLIKYRFRLPTQENLMEIERLFERIWAFENSVIEIIVKNSRNE